MRQLIGEELGAQLPPIWGLNDESEPYNVWRDLAPVAPNMWPMLGLFLQRRCFCLLG